MPQKSSAFDTIGLQDFADSKAQRARWVRARFFRMWEFYWTDREAGFRECSIGVTHLLLNRTRHRYTRAARGA